MASYLALRPFCRSAIFQDDFKLISEEPFIEYAITI